MGMLNKTKKYGCALFFVCTAVFFWGEGNVQAQDVGILVTDWGTPNGFDENYYSQIGYRGSRGPAADPDIPPEDQTCIETYVGIWPTCQPWVLCPTPCPI